MATEVKQKQESYLSPSSRHAHADVESGTPGRDDLRSLYEPQDGQTRAEHASRLHHTDREARDTYERGAAIYGDTLIIPREASGRALGSDTIRLGSHEHAVKNFSRFITDPQELAGKAAEFVDLGKQISGRTSDRHTRLVVFRVYYDLITRNEAGKFRSPEEQRARLDEVLDEMRLVARAMRAEEWTNEKQYRFVEVSEWEQSHATHEHDAGDGLPAHLTEELSEDYARVQDGEERFQSFALTGEHDSLRLEELPPRLPDHLSGDDLKRLLSDALPRLDHLIETGVPPRGIITALAREQRKEEARERDRVAAGLLRTPETGEELPVTRLEQLRGLYTLRTLAESARRTEERKVSSQREAAARTEDFARAVAQIDAEIERRGFTDRERADALEAVGKSGALEYRAVTGRLSAYEASEKREQQLAEEAILFSERERAGADFQSLFAEHQTLSREAVIDQREQLARGNNARIPRGRFEPGTAYPELTGEAPQLSSYAALRLEDDKRAQATRFQLSELLTDARVERAREQTVEETRKHRQHFLMHFGALPEDVREARAAVQPFLNSLRSQLLLVKEQRDSLTINERRRTAGAERILNRNDAPPRAMLFVALSSNSYSRLPVESFNEYKTLTSAAEQARVELRLFRGLYGEEVTGHSPERDELYTFRKEYVRYRMRDPETRLLNENALYRDFYQRLNTARTPDELRRAANDIRRENYDRERNPESYASEHEMTGRVRGGVKHALTENEMRRLLLGPAPEHYTEEMRRYRYDKAASGAARERNIRQLARGAMEPSPALQSLLSEFARTEASERAQHLRNVNLFISELINPPREGVNRFSPKDLYRIHEGLSTTERNYLFRVITEKKESLKGQLPARDRERLQQILDGQERAPAERQGPLRLPTESASFRRYSGAVAWREAELLNLSSARLAPSKTGAHHKGDQGTFPTVVTEQKLETIVTLLRDFKPAQVTYAAEHLRASEWDEERRAGEILAAFKDMKRQSSADGQFEYQITTPENSTIPRESWQRLFDYLQPRLTEQRPPTRDEIPQVLVSEIRRTALSDSWATINPASSREIREALMEEPELERAAARFQQEIDGAVGLQQRVSVAAAASNQAQRTPTGGTATARSDALRIYTYQVKADFLDSFTRIDLAHRNLDESRAAFVKEKEERQAHERAKRFAEARPQLQQRIGDYLKTVLRDHGPESFEHGRGAAHHAAMVSSMIKENFKERGVALSSLNLTDQSIDRTAQEIIEGLPRDLRNARERNIALAKGHDSDHSLRGREAETMRLQSDERDLQGHDLSLIGDESRTAREAFPSRHEHAPAETSLEFDEEFVEQKLASHLDRVRPAMPRQHARPLHDTHHPQAHAHDNVQQMEKVMQLTLTR